MRNSEQYIEVSIKLGDYSEELSEIVIAEVSSLPYEAFTEEPPLIKCYIQKDLYSQRDLKVVLSGIREVDSFEATLVQGENWNKEWESSFKPIVVDGKVTIKSSQNKDVPKTRYNIWIDPQMAFGTGSHDTTYMMMSAMLGIEERIKGHSVLDMGCGSGVLAILAAKMGASVVTAIDIDAVAARSAWGNARWNRVGTRVRTLCGDASLLQLRSYDIILANIHRNIIIEDLSTYVRSLKRGGTILLSGFFESDVKAIEDAAEELKMKTAARFSRGGWACIMLQ
ncbi:MAG: 50S ribosomal protein L11 methyltransferase [Bacteroidales bacterium]|nr:50S ribosomal protein L11 methyltransferase [Bacteroidales bacterium]